MVFTINDTIPVNIPSHPYILCNWSILCNCDIEAESIFHLESLAACNKLAKNLVMYFTVNLAFVNYVDGLPDTLDAPTYRIGKHMNKFYLFLCNLLSFIQVYYK